jgi:endonuclease/exonuclease/phosphatase family metal-dependent hydrolase
MLATATAGALVGAAVFAAPMPAQAAKKDGGDLKVMTQNLYLGADLFPAVEAATQGTTEFLLAAAKVYQEAMASDFETRAAQFAKTVKAKKPAIIGLQEVTNWIAARTNEGPALQNQDFLKIVNKALKAEGLAYKVIGVSDNATLGPFPYIDPASSCGAPVSDSPTSWECRIMMMDRDVILVNTRAKGLSYTKKSVKSGQFKAQQTFLISGRTISFSRGWVYADMTYKGAKFRFANTHLEVGGESEAIQQKQGKEFVKLVKKGAKTVVATGDFNTDAYGNYSPKTYQQLTKYFTDAWKPKRDGKGLSCCQNAALSNPVSQNDTRIDFVFGHGNVKSKSAVNTNVSPFRQTPAPLYESDHGGVVAKLQVR